MTRFAHELRGMEAAMRELSGKANSSVAMAARAAAAVEQLSKQGTATQLLLDQLRVAVEALRAPAIPATSVEAIHAPAPVTAPSGAHTTLLETVGAAVAALDATGRSHSDELREIKTLATALRTASNGVDARLRSIDGRVAEIGSAVQQLQTSLAAFATKSESEARSSSMPGLLALGVCAQLLALAAFLFYKSANNKRHLL
jgi:chromosome segregation ATPase